MIKNKKNTEKLTPQPFSRLKIKKKIFLSKIKNFKNHFF